MTMTSVSNALWSLGLTVRTLAKAVLDSGEIKPVKRTYLVEKYDSFDYAKGTYGWHTETPEKDDPLPIRIHIYERVKPTPEYEVACQEVASYAGASKEQASFWLTSLVWKLIQDPRDFASDQQLNRIIVAFVNELQHGDIDWRGRAWLQGLKLEPERLDLAPRVVLRQPNKADLETSEPLDVLNLGIWGYPGRHLGQVPGAILEFEARGKDNSVVHMELMRFIWLLRLYKPMSISYILLQERSDSVLRPGTTGQLAYRPAVNMSGVLTASESARLQAFIKVFGTLIPAEVLQSGTSDSHYLGIALTRYGDALVTQQSPEARLAYAIMTLEALFLSKEGGELEEQLALRAGKLLSLLGKRAMEAYNDMKRAYDIRSRYVHADSLTQEQRNELGDLLQKTVEYARTSLLAFMLLQLQKGQTKESIVGRIRNALLEDNAEEKLKNSFPAEIALIKAESQ